MTAGTKATIERMRWWHIEELAPIEADLFGAEKWSASMFWNELANGHFYVVATDNDEVTGYGGLSVSGGEGWGEKPARRKEKQRAASGRAPPRHPTAPARRA